MERKRLSLQTLESLYWFPTATVGINFPILSTITNLFKTLLSLSHFLTQKLLLAPTISGMNPEPLASFLKPLSIIMTNNNTS